MNGAFQPLVSIIVPVYNTEKFLSRAIESILAQTYENIQLILVNDGSVDRSGEICNQYARKNSRIKVIHQSNGGVSAARNAGLDVSSGEYIQFVDSDDEIESTMTEKLVNEMNLQDCDIVICGYSIIGQTTKKVSYHSRLYSLDDFLMHAYLESVTSFMLWGSCFMLIKNTIIRSFQIRFDSTFAVGEDGLFTLQYLLQSKSIYVLDQTLYRRYVYEPEERVSAISLCALDVYELRIEYFKRLFSIFEQREDEFNKSTLLASFYDKLIAGLVRLGAYSEYYSDKELNQRLDDVVNSVMTIRAGRVYKRKRKGDSILIPLFMKWRNIALLKWALRRSGKSYTRKYGKKTHVCSVFKDTIIDCPKETR